MMHHVTINGTHLLVRDPVAKAAARRCLEDSTDCPTCGCDLWAGATIIGPARRDARSGLALECSCGEQWALKRGDPLEAEL